jgi:hypothetical protein
VVVDGDLYVRAYNGIRASWYLAAIKQKAGRITAAGQNTEVNFEAVAGKSTNASTLHKYFSSPYLRPMIDDGARAATVQLIALRDGHKCSARLLWGPVRKRTIEHAKTAWTVN